MKRLLGWTVASALVLVAGTAFAKPPVPISECGTIIVEPGKYKLTNDLVGCPWHGVIIAGSDIVFDLDGHSISCNTNDGALRLGGVVVWEFMNWSTISDVTVANGHVSDCSDGITLVGTKDSKVKKMSSSYNLAWGDASGTGITIWFSENALVTKNHTYGNQFQGIGVWDSVGTVVKHNMSTDNNTGIWTQRANATEVSCNKTFGNEVGVVLGPWSTGGLVKGNVAKSNWRDGISAWGWSGEQPWDSIASGNTFKHNISEENPFDHVELFYDFDTDSASPHPEGVCLNRWFENQFVTSWGPEGCIGEPVELDDDDVCALDDDDDSDSDSDSD